VSRDLEEALRRALRPVDPGEQFTARVLARVLARVAQQPHAERPAGPAPDRRRRLWLPLGLAASLAAALILRHAWHAQRDLQGLQARRQLIEALRVTSQKLDLAYRIVNTPAAAADEPDPGA
jgi:hypothetical protein